MSSLRNKIAAIPFAKKAYRGLKSSAYRRGVSAMHRALSGRRHLILTFHRVRPTGQEADPFDTCPSVSFDEFRRIIEHVRERFNVVSLSELCDRRGKKAPMAAVTFDDGWRDNYDVAFPILREFDVPATIFVTTGKIGSSKLFWQQTLGEVFRTAGSRPENETTRELRSLLGLRDGEALTAELYRETVSRWKKLEPAAISDRLDRIGETCSATNENGNRHFLDAAEIRAMASAGIAFGSHTVTHPILTLLSPAEIERELSESKAALEGLLGSRIDALAYPDGQCSDQVMHLSRAAGYRVGCTTRSRWIAGYDNPICLPRIEPPYYSCNGVNHFRAQRSSAARAARASASPQRPAADKIKILFLIDDFDGPEGGTEQHLLFLQQELPRDRFELHFGVLSGIRRMAAEEFPVRPVMLGEGTPSGPRGVVPRLRRLARHIQAIDADVVHAFCRRSELYALLATRLARRGKVLGVRRNIGYWHTWRSRWSARLIGLLGAHYAANCEAAREFAARVEWIPRRRVTVIYNPAPTKRLREGLANLATRESLGIINGEQVVGMVAVVKPIKDYATFLRSARLVLDKHPHTRFLAIGPQEPEYTAQMRQLARELGIEKQVTWVGPVPNPMSVLPLVDVAVLSSQSEAMSNSIVEYMAAGVPVVATEVGGTKELIEDGKTGFVVPAQSPVAMSEHISHLLCDAPTRHTIVADAYNRANKLFSVDYVLNRYAGMYENMLPGALLILRSSARRYYD